MIETSTKQSEILKKLAFGELLQRISDQATQTEGSHHGPVEEFEWLRAYGLLKVVLPDEILDFKNDTISGILELLVALGKANLSVGRIFEGHINSLYLVHLYGTEVQKQYWYNKVREEGALFGVWNTQSNDAVVFERSADSVHVSGSKTFCSGAPIVTHALITGRVDNHQTSGSQMAIVEMKGLSPNALDWSEWKPLGMKASVSIKVNFGGLILDSAHLLGAVGQYLAEPYFSTGAIRFAAVQLGGAEAIVDYTIDFLRLQNRLQDPFQKMRLSKMMTLATAGGLWLKRFVDLSGDPELSMDRDRILIANTHMARTSIEDICLDIMDSANKCVGARGLMYPHPFERIFRDLSFYLRQPAPDATRIKITELLLD